MRRFLQITFGDRQILQAVYVETGISVHEKWQQSFTRNCSRRQKCARGKDVDRAVWHKRFGQNLTRLEWRVGREHPRQRSILIQTKTLGRVFNRLEHTDEASRLFLAPQCHGVGDVGGVSQRRGRLEQHDQRFRSDLQSSDEMSDRIIRAGEIGGEFGGAQ